MFRRLFQFCLPSLLGVSAAALIAALAETIWNTERALNALAGAGFLLVYAVPLGLVLSMAGRALHKAWRLDERLAACKDERGASPGLAAWSVFLVFAALVQAWGSFQGVRLLFTATRVAGLVVLAAPVVVLLVSFGIFLLSRPMVDILARRMARIEESRREADKRALFTPRRITLTLLSFFLAALLLILLLLVRPRLARVDLGFVGYLVVFSFGVVLFPRLWKRAGMAPAIRRSLAAAILLLVGLCISLSVWMRYERPYAMLAIWGDTTLAGWAIDTTFEVQGLREDLSVEGIVPKANAGALHPNVVLITIDTLRADQVPFYGGKSKMPAFTKFARKAMVFDRAFSPGNDTRRSLPSIATGLSPRRVRGRIIGWAQRLDPRHVLLAERFRAGGYATAGFFCCPDQFDPGLKLGLVRGLDTLTIDNVGESLAKKTSDWLHRRGQSKQPLFLWTHYVEPHNWARDYEAKDGANSNFDRYGLSLQATDANLGIVIAAIRESLGENTIIVVTSDHGEGLGEHGVQHHSASLFNTEIHVPLVIAGPGISPGRLEQAVGLVDLAPTLLELAGFAAPGMPHMDGLSLAPELKEEREDKLGAGEAYSVMVADRAVLEDQAALISGRYKLVERPGSTYQLYDLSLDPKELKDIKEQAPELLRSMQARLARRRAVDAVPAF